jgi:hypothetical protein
LGRLGSPLKIAASRGDGGHHGASSNAALIRVEQFRSDGQIDIAPQIFAPFDLIPKKSQNRKGDMAEAATQLPSRRLVAMARA